MASTEKPEVGEVFVEEPVAAVAEEKVVEPAESSDELLPVVEQVEKTFEEKIEEEKKEREEELKGNRIP